MERTERARALRVVKRSGSREAFDPSKILQGIDIACGKRPVPEVARQELVKLFFLCNIYTMEFVILMSLESL